LLWVETAKARIHRVVDKTKEQRGQNGIPEADMEAIIVAHESALLRYAAGILNDPHAAQDVVQNAFIKLFRLWKPGQQPSEAVRPWLFRVTHNEAVDHLRREGRIRLLHFKHAEERKATDNPGPSEADRLELVMNGVTQLPAPERQVFLLRLQEGLSYRQICEVTGKTQGYVGLLLHNAVRKLAKIVRDAGLDRKGERP